MTCSCAHDAVYHDAKGCMAWDTPARNDRRANPRKCLCTKPLTALVRNTTAPSPLPRRTRVIKAVL